MRHLEPRETRPARMGALAVLPVFLALGGRRAVVAGSGEALVWKAELLAAAGAHVAVYAPTPCAELAALAAQPPAGSVEIIPRGWQPTDFAGAALAVGALEGRDASRFAQSAGANGVPVNIVDTPELSTFSFGDHRQPLSRCCRHQHRWCRARLGPGHSRQDRRAFAPRPCRLGGRRPRLARRAQRAHPDGACPARGLEALCRSRARRAGGPGAHGSDPPGRTGADPWWQRRPGRRWAR